MTEPPQDWDELADWWDDEVATDPSNPEDVLPLLASLLQPLQGTVLDLGCGEGQGLRHLQAHRGQIGGGDGSFPALIGCDLSIELLRRSVRTAPVVRCALPDLAWMRAGSLSGAYAVYVLDLLEDETRFFAEVARVVEPGGALVVIVNHPLYTAPGSGPYLDEDEVVLWRWGDYLGSGSTVEPAGPGNLRFYHRSFSRLLTAAAGAGWGLQRVMERGLSEPVMAAHPGYEGQEGIPRLLGVRWHRIDPSLPDPQR